METGAEETNVDDAETIAEDNKELLRNPANALVAVVMKPEPPNDSDDESSVEGLERRMIDASISKALYTNNLLKKPAAAKEKKAMTST